MRKTVSSPLWAPGDLELAREIFKLKERGLGYRRIGKLLNLHYKKVERLYKKYLALLNGVKVTQPGDAATHPVISASLEPEDTGVLTETIRGWGDRLGATQRLVIRIMLSEPHMWWSISQIRARMGLLKHNYSRQAIYMALKRLILRGIVEYMPIAFLVTGEKIRGLYRLRFYAPIDQREILVHNLRVAGTQIVSKEEGKTLPLTDALLKAWSMAKTWPVNQCELHMDYKVDPRITGRLRELGWRQTVLYSPKPGYIRIEHRLWDPQGLIATPDQREEWLTRYERFTFLTVEIASRELSRVANNKHR